MAKKEEVATPAAPVNKALATINKLKPMDLANDPRVHKKFVTLYKQIHGNDRGELAYQAEKFHFMKLLQEKPALQACSSISLYGAFLDVAVQGLSVDPTKKLAYIVPYGKTAQLQISGYGELQLRVDYKQVKYVDKPVIVYDCDSYEVGSDSTGKKTIHYKKQSPRPDDAKVIASFMRITRNDGSIELIDFDADDFESWRSASKQPDSGAWTKHYASMISTKTVKHSFNTYPKLKLKGQFSKLETEIDETEDIDYSLVDEETGEVVEVKAEPKETKKKDDEAYGEQEKEPETVTATIDDDDEGNDIEETY